MLLLLLLLFKAKQCDAADKIGVEGNPSVADGLLLRARLAWAARLCN